MYSIYKMFLIWAEGYKNESVHILIIKKPGEIWARMKNVHKGLSVKSMSDLILKEIYGIYETRQPYKRTN